MPSDGSIAIIIYDGHAGYDTQCHHDLTKASLLGAPEQHVGFYEKGNKAAGTRLYTQRTHFMDYTDDYCSDRVVHFNASDFTTNDGQFKVEITGGQVASFHTKYRPGKAPGTISIIFSAEPREG